MVYLHFPSNLTEEEQMLQAKYQKLRKKKKALHSLKAPKQDPEPLVQSKRPTDAKDAKELAKKLIKSGAIKVPDKLQPVTEKTTFKRSIGLERKLSAAEKGPSGYQPFSTSHPEEEIHESRIKTKGLYHRFIPASDLEEEILSEKEAKALPAESKLPRQGNTIYVYGYNITQDILKKAFSNYGNIFNVNMESDKNCGFITFDKPESAEKAIAEMNGSIVDQVQLKVSLARHQMTIDNVSDSTSSAPWSTIAASHSQKGSHNDKRDAVVYDEFI